MLVTLVILFGDNWLAALRALVAAALLLGDWACRFPSKLPWIELTTSALLLGTLISELVSAVRLCSDDPKIEF